MTNRKLSKRPFLIIKVMERPARGIRTENKGWAGNSDNWDVYENTSVVDRVSNKLLAESSVIVDITAQTCVVNNRFAGADKTDIARHYLQKYQQQVNEAMDIWNKRQLIV